VTFYTIIVCNVSVTDRKILIYFAEKVVCALTLLAWHKGEHPACKKLSDEVPAWLSVCSVIDMVCIWTN